jgi:hypothetical protein
VHGVYLYLPIEIDAGTGEEIDYELLVAVVE